MKAITESPTAPLPVFLSVATSKGTRCVDIRTIVRIEALSSYSKLHFANGSTLVVSKVLRWFAEQLPAEQFLRTHRTHLVNRTYIRRVERKRQLRIELRADEWIAVARLKRRSLQHALCQRA